MNNTKIMGDALNKVELEDNPFTDFEKHNRIMEEVYILQIILEFIKKKDIDLFSEQDKDSKGIDFDTYHVRKLTENITSFIDATKRIF